MEITEIRIKLMEGSEDRLRAFCSITLDNAFVIRDLKIIDGSNGPFVAMPSRKLTGHCHRCNHKNHLRAGFCNHCGAKLQSDDTSYESPQKLYADVAHPINSECREMIQNAVITEFQSELNRYQQPGYRSRYDDEFGYEDVDAGAVIEAGSSTNIAREIEDAGNAKTEHADDSLEAADQKAVRPQHSDSQVPPRPKFLEHPSQDSVASRNEDEENDFGVGVF